jgi:CheY-like chemotaxis protein/two-component sensor histidine kinase/HPt (histidine-containing phosphotransfer) domain-containing protein
LLGIINDILDLSKIEAGKLELMLGNYETASLINDTVQLNVMRYESKPIEFTLEVGDTVPSVLFGDELRIKQILNNLLSNAFKYTDSGSIKMSVSAEPENGKEGFDVLFICRVSDTGQGLTAEQVEKLGDEYARFNAEANRTTVGTGLGLNITRNLVRMMDGELLIESEPGRGSAFTMRLPQKTVDSAVLGRDLIENLKRFTFSDASQRKETHVTCDFMPYGNVLIVDDVEMNVYVAKGLMAHYGLSIDTAVSGFEAIDKIKAGETYDVIFMDHMMPQMDGIETVKKIRELGYSLPIVALTANALAGQAEMFLEKGFDGFISKPIDRRQLDAILNRLIRNKQSPEVLAAAREQQKNFNSTGKAFGGSKMAAIFVGEAEKAASGLETICRYNGRRADDASLFTTYAYGLKNALASVGETELSAAARKLERAGRQRNIKSVLSDVPAFLDALRKVIEKLKPDNDTEIAGDMKES